MIVDGHSDVLYGMNQKRLRGAANGIGSYRDWFLRGQVEGCIAVLWSNPDLDVPAGKQIAQQLQTLQQVMHTYRDTWMQLCNRADLAWAQRRGCRFFLLGAEGLDSYPQKIESIDWLYEQGVRHVGLTWNGGNQFAGGVYTDFGLTALGRHAVRQIQHKHMLLDVSHLNDRSLREVLSVADGPLIASHSNCRALCAVPRNLTDRQIKAIASTGGVIGLNSHPSFVHACREKQDLQHLTDHVVRMAELVGTDHVGFGFDLNYWEEGDQAEEMKALKGYDQLGQLLDLLQQRGFDENERNAICRDNFLRVMEQVLA